MKKEPVEIVLTQGTTSNINKNEKPTDVDFRVTTFIKKTKALFANLRNGDNMQIENTPKSDEVQKN